MKELTLIQSADFGGVQCDFYGKNDEVYMTSEQLGECLGYSSGRKGIDNLVDRNEYLRGGEFSVTLKMRATDGKMYNTRIFTEDGIYEVTMLAKTEKAKEFRAWVRGVLKALRSGEAVIVKPMTAYQQMMADTRQRNARIQSARILTQLAGKYKGTTYEQVLNAHATRELTGEFLLPLPQLERKTYSATEIGKMVGVTANRVGLMTNAYKLKTDEYGEWFKDKSRYSNKEVPSFRYYDNIVPELRKLMEAE